MTVAMVDVRKVRMAVGQRLMPVGMGVRLFPVPVEIVQVQVMLVVRMLVRMFERLVVVDMLVPLADMQPYAGAHQRRREPEGRAHGIA